MFEKFYSANRFGGMFNKLISSHKKNSRKVCVFLFPNLYENYATIKNLCYSALFGSCFAIFDEPTINNWPPILRKIEKETPKKENNYLISKWER